MNDSRAVRRYESRADLLDDATDQGDVERSGAHQFGLRCSTRQQPEDQIRAARLTPVVVERNDVRMFQPGHELRLRFEPLDERRVVGEIRTDDLDGNITVVRRVRRGERTTERAFTDDVMNRVPAEWSQ